MRILTILAVALFITTLSAAEDTYTGNGAKGDASKFRYSLILKPGGQAYVTIVFSRRERSTAQATWERINSTQIALQFINREGQPRGKPTIWQQDGAKLTPISWGTEEWAEAPPPILRKS